MQINYVQGRFMKVALIVEGRSDAAVITNILKGALNISSCDIHYMVPEFDYDETTLHQMRIEQFSNWNIVKQHCQNREKIDTFLSCFDDDRFVILHIDSDTRNETGYNVGSPSSIDDASSISLLRQNIKCRIIEGLENQFVEKIAFAIAIQEIDAWVLTLYSDTNNTDVFPNVKERLWRQFFRTLSPKDRQRVKSLDSDKYNQYLYLSNNFKKNKILGTSIDKNVSLRLFCQELETFVH